MIIDGLGPPGPKQIKIPLTPSDGCIHFTIKLLLSEQLLRMKRVTSEKKEKETGRYVATSFCTATSSHCLIAFGPLISLLMF